MRSCHLEMREKLMRHAWDFAVELTAFPMHILISYWKWRGYFKLKKPTLLLLVLWNQISAMNIVIIQQLVNRPDINLDIILF